MLSRRHSTCHPYNFLNAPAAGLLKQQVPWPSWLGWSRSAREAVLRTWPSLSALHPLLPLPRRCRCRRAAVCGLVEPDGMKLTSVSSLSFRRRVALEAAAFPALPPFPPLPPENKPRGAAQRREQKLCHGRIENALGTDLRARILCELRPFQSSHRSFLRPFLSRK